MPSWNSTYPIFNDSIIHESSGGLGYSTRRMVSRNSEARVQDATRGYWILDLSGMMLNDEQYQELLALQMASRGMLYEVLIRNVRNCLFEEADGTAAPIGTGTGAEQTFQLRKRFRIQGRTFYQNVRFPNHDYHPLKDLNKLDWKPLPPLQIYVNGTLNSSWSVDRNSGLLTITATGSIAATGGFYTRMLAPDIIPVTPRAHLFEIDGGVQFIEPFDGED